MLAAAAQQGFTELLAHLVRIPPEPDLADAAARLVSAYVEFALQDPARFAVMFASGFDKHVYDDLMRQTVQVQTHLETALAA